MQGTHTQTHTESRRCVFTSEHKSLEPGVSMNIQLTDESANSQELCQSMIDDNWYFGFTNLYLISPWGILVKRSMM